VLSCVVDHILQELNILYLTIFRTYKTLLDHPKQKPRKGGVLRPKHPPQSPVTGKFFRSRHLALLPISLISLRLCASGGSDIETTVQRQTIMKKM
jgi:hypothetical protein